MGSGCPPHWTFAARAAYFGDRMCAFCDHRNPAGAKFCNDCASPLHLKPCKECDAVNDHTATHCYRCGVPCPVSFGTPQAMPASVSADPVPAGAASDHVAVAATARHRPLAVPVLEAGWPVRFLATAMGTILIIAAYHVYRNDVAMPDAMRVSSQHTEITETTATPAPAAPAAVESSLVEAERMAGLPAPPGSTYDNAPTPASANQSPVPVPDTKRASAQQRPAAVSATKRASAHQASVPERQARAATSRGPHRIAATRDSARVARTSKKLRSDPWQLMQVSLGRCGGDLIARIVCGQRVRRHFCEGRWGEVPHCSSGIVNDHGQ
jgi:ribosomal protein L40E